MKRILIFANTYFQMIVALQLNNTLFENDEVTLLLSDKSKNAEHVCGELNKNRVFAGGSYFVKSSEPIKKKRIKDRLYNVIRMSFCSSNRFSYLLNGITNLHFDELVSYSTGNDVWGIYSILYSHNKMLRVSRMEEGIMAYRVVDRIPKERKAIKIVRQLIHKKEIFDEFDKFYCFYPQLYKGKLKAVEIPKILTDSKTADTLRTIFALDEAKLAYPEKYIFFAGLSGFEGKDIGEFQLICRIADLVGKDNLLIKKHPRDFRSIYEDNGFKLDDNSAIPWEAIQLSRDFSDKVLMTVTSTAALVSSLMSDTPPRSYYMFKCCDVEKNKYQKLGADIVEELLSNEEMKDTFKMVHIANAVEDIV